MATVSEECQLPGFGASLRAAAPSDDAGAQTADRYEWQAAMAARDLLAMYLDLVEGDGDPVGATDHGLVCEYHEDWATVLPTSVEIVSGKHKEPRFGSFTTVSGLLDDGGLYHLFDRWLALGASTRCRLATTAGLDADAALIHEVCAHRSASLTDELPNERCERAYRKLLDGVARRRADDGQPMIEDLGSLVLPRFLGFLVMETGLPRRDFVPAMAPTAYAAPVARAVGRPDLAAELWESVLALVRARMRAAGPSRRGQLPSLAGKAEDELERRAVTVADVHVAIRTALAQPGGFAPLPRLTVTNKMAVKMADGRCSATSIERAEELRRLFTSWRRRRRSEPGGREAELELDLLLRKVADRATTEVRTDDQPWGARLWAEIENRLETETGQGAARGLDSDMLLGGISDLTNGCKIWYSEPFDAKGRLAELREAKS